VEFVKKEVSKEEVSKQEVSKEEVSKKEVSKEEVSKEEVLKSASISQNNVSVYNAASVSPPLRISDCLGNSCRYRSRVSSSFSMTCRLFDVSLLQLNEDRRRACV